MKLKSFDYSVNTVTSVRAFLLLPSRVLTRRVAGVARLRNPVDWLENRFATALRDLTDGVGINSSWPASKDSQELALVCHTFLIVGSDESVHTVIDVKPDNIQNRGSSTPRSIRLSDKLRRAQHSSTSGGNQP
jgi:hypothetical protein